MSCGCSPQEQGISKQPEAKIFYYNWMGTSRFALDIESLKAQSIYKTALRNSAEIEQLLSIVNETSFSEEMEVQYMNGRLLIELQNENNEKQTYFASRIKICFVEKNVCRRIDQEFRDQIENLIVNCQEN